MSERASSCARLKAHSSVKPPASYRLGDRLSGYTLATVWKSWLPPEMALTHKGRVEPILEQALAGDSSAALERAHAYHADLDVELLRRVLTMAVSAGSEEAKEPLRAL